MPESVLSSDLIDLGDISPSLAFLRALIGKHTLTAKIQEVPVVGRPGKAVVLPEIKGTDAINKAKNGIQNLNSSRIKIETKKLYNSAILSVELQKYSVVELDALLAGNIRTGMLLSMADGIINGDAQTGTTNINYNGADISTIDNHDAQVRFNFDNGLRKVALAGGKKSSIDIGTLEGANDIFKLQALVTSTADPAKKIILMDQATYYALLEKEDFKDASRNGKNSTIYTGALTNIAGSDVFITDLLAKASSDGKVSSTEGNNTTGTILVFDVTAIQHGDFDELKFNAEDDFALGTILETYGFWGFTNMQGVQGLNFVAIGYNVTHA
ncbi:MAG: hypothetical protein Q4B28_06905 [bacterium]|nr:hypothetical protein [bacterium]